MRYATSARWTNQSSFIHRLDARIKLVLLVAFVVSLALLERPSGVQLLSCLMALAMISRAARLPLWRVLRTALLVVPFVGLFSLIIYLSGDPWRAWFILAKSYLSTLSVLIAISSTPLPELLAAARFFRVPALLVEVTQLIYRYLFVLAGEAKIMQTAFHSRGGKTGTRAIEASSGMIAVLFGKSYEKASVIHQSMGARGFSGTFVRYEFRGLRLIDVGVLSAGLLLVTALHLFS